VQIVNCYNDFMPRILIIEDDPQIIEAIEKTVTLEAGFSTDAVSSPTKALAAAIKLQPDLILLDIRLPGGDGRHIIKDLKSHAATASIPVIFLTGMSSEGDKVLGLDLGADDYVVKPFGAMELLARIRAVLRRYDKEAATAPVDMAGIFLDPEGRTAKIGGKPVKLQPKEFEILYLLASHPGKALTRAFLIENSSSYGAHVPTRALDTHIKNLRKKLGSRAKLIETLPKLGYRFAAP
jgi:two-component system alkaline phosphatase synthesis response regulator PhoP